MPSRPLAPEASSLQTALSGAGLAEPQCKEVLIEELLWNNDFYELFE